MRLGRQTLIPFALLLYLPGYAAEPPASGTPSIQDAEDASAAPTLKVYTRETIVDVSPSAANGNAVRGLRKSNFTVEENSKPQAIHSFIDISAYNGNRKLVTTLKQTTRPPLASDQDRSIWTSPSSSRSISTFRPGRYTSASASSTVSPARPARSKFPSVSQRSDSPRRFA